MLSIFYSEGVGVPTNYKKALEFGTKAAERGFPAAQATLGSCYRNGWGVPQDFKTAYAWFSLASAADTIFATSRDEAAKHLTPQALLEAQALASKLYSEILTNKVGGL
ncbi:MAG: Secretory immunoglobulin A-binding protein EsiB [Nitrosomonadaceae bacterium]|nr:Secretory immunoglobulin A-binding protein EsiB [Nitrosomonadaceae bacterium]